MRFKAKLLKFGEDGNSWAVIFLALYLLIVYPAVTGVRLSTIISFSKFTFIIWLSMVFFALWIVSEYTEVNFKKKWKKWKGSAIE